MRSTASERFDPYHKWLGIPPSEQPADCYRLLGLARFEDDPEVIAAAADRQMAHVKSFAAGRNGAESQALLNELAQARLTLLNVQRKAAYDRRLQGEQPLANSATRVDGAHAGMSPRTAATRPSFPQSPIIQREPSASVAGRPRAQRAKRTQGPLVIVACSLVLLALCFGIALATRPGVGTALAPNPPFENDPPVARPVPQPEPPSPQNPPERATLNPAPRRKDSEPRPAPRPSRTQPAPIIPQRVPRADVGPSNSVAQLKADPLDRARDFDGQQEAPRPGPPQVAHRVPLDVTKRRVGFSLKSGSTAALQVLALRGCPVPYEIYPRDGRLDEQHDVKIVLDGPEEVTIEIRYVKGEKDQTSFNVAASTGTLGRSATPFFIPELSRTCQKIAREGEKLSDAMAQMEAEADNLYAYINGPGVKPLAAVGNAKRRILVLKNGIAAAATALPEVQADFDAATALHAFAKQFQGRCQIEFGRFEDDADR